MVLEKHFATVRKPTGALIKMSSHVLNLTISNMTLIHKSIMVLIFIDKKNFILI